ncbi:MAG: transporter substrate-binding domain-containing protein [Sedimenticola sp.]
MARLIKQTRLVAYVCPFLFVGMFLTAANVYAQQAEIKISSDPWVPWVLSAEDDGAPNGIAIDLANEIFSRMDVPIDISIYPYKRCLFQMETGKRDMLLMAKKTPEREKFMLYSDVVVNDPQLLYYATQHKEDFEWSELSDLKGATIGVVLGFDYGQLTQYAKKTHDYSLIVSSDDDTNLRILLAGRIDLLAMNRSTADHLIKKNPELKGKIRAATNPISVAEFHFAISRKGNATHLLPRINETIAEMNSDGSLERILRQQ